MKYLSTDTYYGLTQAFVPRAENKDRFVAIFVGVSFSAVWGMRTLQSFKAMWTGHYGKFRLAASEIYLLQ